MAYTTIDDGSEYFHAQLYTGDGSTDNAITNGANAGDFKPDWLWIKSRSYQDLHNVFDSSRGRTKRIFPNLTNAEGDSSPDNFLKSFDTDGFTTGNDAGMNTDGGTLVAWQWKANGGTETNSQAESGSNIACSVQANTTAGFSIITYTGTGGTGHTFLHGLGSAPAWFIIKRRNDTEDWLVYHHKNTSAPETDHLLLNTTDATSDSDTRFDDTAPNGTEIALGNNAVCNADASTYVCYAFKEIKGFSKFGSYTANDNANGVFLYTGFKPAWLMCKCTSDNGGDRDWTIFDNKRNTFNVANLNLKANENTTENNNSRIPLVDFVSNGIKFRSSHGETNGGSETYIYMAFAESPFVSSEGVPTTAR